MADLIIWPTNLLKPQTISVDIAHRNLRGPSAPSGFTQVVSNSAGIWRATFSDIPVYNKEMIKAWRAIDTLAEGMLNPISIPVWDYPRSPGSADDYGRNIRDFSTSLPHSDGTYFSDDAGYVGSFSTAKVNATASTGAVTVVINKVTPFSVEPGQRFSINHRLYQIRTVTSQSSNIATVTVRPPLREALNVGDVVEFNYPRLRVRLVSDEAMYLPLNFNQQSFPSLDFIEDV